MAEQPVMELLRDQETEPLSSLEDRIVKAVEAFTALKKENAALKQRLAASEEKDRRLAAALEEKDAARRELESLRAEQKTVRARIEKLLGQIDAISAG